jgi:hypothetical protein
MGHRPDRDLTSLFSFRNLLVKVKGKVTLRLADYRQSVRIGAKLLEAHD